MAIPLRSPVTSYPTPSEGGISASGKHEFLSPDWIHEVVEAVEEVKRSDPYFGGLVADFSFRVAYVVEEPPAALRQWYGDGGDLVISVDLKQGVVNRLEFGDKIPKKGVSLVVTTTYRVAKKLYLGEMSPASSMLGGRVRVKPSSGFRAWAKLAPKSLVTASRVIRIGRGVETAFDSQPKRTRRRR